MALCSLAHSRVLFTEVTLDIKANPIIALMETPAAWSVLPTSLGTAEAYRPLLEKGQLCSIAPVRLCVNPLG